MCKKVGIITIFKVNNYGAELQAYATQKALQIMGYDAELINYPFYKNERHIRTTASRPVFPMTVKKKFEEWAYPKIAKFKLLIQHNKNDEKRKANFERFYINFARLSPEYRKIEELYNTDRLYDAYIVGSDQVWNPGIYSSLDPYFLKFAPRDKKRLSYASSFGVSSFPDYTREYYKEALTDLNAIGVREENAVQIVKDLSGRQAQWVLDPTLLLDASDWSSIAKKMEEIPEKFVLLYELTPCPSLKEFALYIAKEKNAKVVRLTKDAAAVEMDGSVINVPVAGPSEFLWMFEHAAFVVTNSFHGTAFSINFNKDFYVVTPARKKNNSRQQSILKLFNLSERLINEGEPLPQKGLWNIDYNPVNKILEEEIKKSKLFLKNAIDGE
jgi:hypothetical protein